MTRPQYQKITTVLSLAAALSAATIVWASNQPYAGQEGRDIASLSAQDVDDLTNGRGWGFAKSAELNGFPGPAHILELGEELELTQAQRDQVQAVFDRMDATARALGAAFIAAEDALDAAFEYGTITEARLTELTDTAGKLRAELRAVHLAAHLEVKPVLSRHQTMLYNQARGYAEGAGHGGHGGH